MKTKLIIAALNDAAWKNELAVFDVETSSLHVINPGKNNWPAVSDNGGNIQINFQREFKPSLASAARALRVAIEDERDTRKGLSAVAADEIARDFTAILGKINRYADAARNEVQS